MRGSNLLDCQTNILALLIALALASSLPAVAAGDASPAEHQRTLSWHLDEHLTEIDTGQNGLTHIGAVGATWLLIESGVDADVQAWAARRSESLSLAASAPALIGGFLVPVAVPLYMIPLRRAPDPQRRAGPRPRRSSSAWPPRTCSRP